jgi:hypothetical protein
MAPNAGIVDACMKLPMVTEYYDVLAAYDADTRTVVTDRDWGKFTAFGAKHADRIYRFDPNLPDETAWMLLEPYSHHKVDTTRGDFHAVVLNAGLVDWTRSN